MRLGLLCIAALAACRTAPPALPVSEAALERLLAPVLEGPAMDARLSRKSVSNERPGGIVRPGRVLPPASPPWVRAQAGAARVPGDGFRPGAAVEIEWPLLPFLSVVPSFGSARSTVEVERVETVPAGSSPPAQGGGDTDGGSGGVPGNPDNPPPSGGAAEQVTVESEEGIVYFPRVTARVQTRLSEALQMYAGMGPGLLSSRLLDHHSAAAWYSEAGLQYRFLPAATIDLIGGQGFVGGDFASGDRAALTFLGIGVTFGLGW